VDLTFRVNNNVPAINSHRALQSNHANLSKNLERLSSGVKINRAVDGPAAFMISEHMRSQIAGLNQAIDNSETAVSLIQTTDANMAEVNTLLNQIRQLAIHAANEGPNNQATLEADQAEIRNILGTIGGISDRAQFGEVKLLDGSMEATGTTTGENLEFVSASLKTGDSREHGFEVRVNQLATKAHVLGKTALTQEIIDAGETLTVYEKGKSASYTSQKGDTADIVVKNLQSAMDKQGIDIELALEQAGQLSLFHRKYGSDFDFQVTSDTAGVLSENGGQISNAIAGKDIIGTINGESAIGKGQFLTGVDDSKSVEGLTVAYYGEGKDVFRDKYCEVIDKPGAEGEVQEEPKPEIPPEGIAVGRVYVNQKGTRFHIGGNRFQTTGISIKSVNPDRLAQNIVNTSDFGSLSDIDVRTFQGAQDTILLVDAAINQITSNRADLGAFQKNTLESNLSNIRIANENLISSESIIRDTDMAKEMASLTRNQIMSQSSNAMLAQANQMPERVLQLLA
jgi:flagellin